MQSDYYQKYLKYKKKYLMLKGGTRPLWYDQLVMEAELIYRAITKNLPESPEEPKNTIILTGSAAIALLLGNENMFAELNMIFTNDKKPADLDFIYEGTYKDDLLNIEKCTIMMEGKEITYTRKTGKISSAKYVTEDNKTLIKDFDLTNMQNREAKKQEKPFTKLPYIIINGIKVITPDKLLSLYRDNEENINPDDIEKVTYNTNKMAQLDSFNKKIVATPELLKKYSPEKIYFGNIPSSQNEQPVRRRNLFEDESGSPPKMPRFL
jgi:hypothetical protein